MIKKENQKQPELVTKYFRAEVKEIDKDNHTVLVTMSDQTLDSYRDIIAADGWKKHLTRYKAHPVLLSSHNYGSLRNQIGISEKTFVQDDALKARLKYFVNAGNEEADWGWTLAEKGVAAYSVGFKPKAMRYWNEMTEEEQKEARIKYKIPAKVTPFRIFLEQELLENSQVVIPANPNAVQESLAKGITDAIETRTNEDIENRLWEDEEAWTEIRYRVKNPDLFVRIRRKKMPGTTPPIYMLVGPLKSDPEGGTKIQALRFPKPSWTLAKAKAWVKAHPDVKKAIEELETKGLDELEDAPDETVKIEKIIEHTIINETAKRIDHTALNDLTKAEPKPPVKEPEPKPEEPKVLSDEQKELVKQLTSEVSKLIKLIGGTGGASGDEPKDDAETQNLYADLLKSGKDTLDKLKTKKKE